MEDTHVSECQALGDLTQNFLEDRLKWIPSSEFSNMESIKTFIDQKISHAEHGDWGKVILLLFGSDGKCTRASAEEFSRIYSLSTHNYDNSLNSMEFRRYAKWLQSRNGRIRGFTKYNDEYYLVTEKCFLYSYSLYGFCSACGILRCSSVWCICGHKELSNAWTSDNQKLDDFIKKSQIQTNSANDAYLEWIPFDFIKINQWGTRIFNSLPASFYTSLKSIPLDLGDKTDDLYYDKVLFNYNMYVCCLVNERLI
jgi:hypothetical protein